MRDHEQRIRQAGGRQFDHRGASQLGYRCSGCDVPATDPTLVEAVQRPGGDRAEVKG
jgi:hypothetical protein